MLARALCLIAVTGCFTAHTPAERPHAMLYNAIAVIAGVAVGVLGVELARASQANAGGYDAHGEDVSTVPVLAGFGGAGALIAGAVMTVGGLAGLALTPLGYEPTHRK